jgi:hypothetical protein
VALSGRVIDRFAEQVAISIDYVFALRWSPDGVTDEDLRRWNTGEQFFSRIPECLIDGRPSTSAPLADAWVAEHRRVEHGA